MATANEIEIEVLFVDDEPFFAAKYRKAMEKKFKVHFLHRANEVIPFMEENLQIRAVVLDIMMPPPEESIKDGVDIEGLSTGLWLLTKMRALESWPFPVLLLSNRNPIMVDVDPVTKNRPGEYIEVYQKAHLLPDDLSPLVETMLAQFDQRQTTRPYDAS